MLEHYDTEGIRQDANTLKQALSDFTNDCNTCDNLIQELNNSWKDKAYDAFAAKYNEYKDTMTGMKDSLQQYIDFLNKAASAVDEVLNSAQNAAR